MVKKWIGVVIGIVGLFIMGYGLGKKSALPEANTIKFTVVGLITTFIGVFLSIYFNKKK